MRFSVFFLGLGSTPTVNPASDVLALASGLPRLRGEPQDSELFGDPAAQVFELLWPYYVPGAIEAPTESLPLSLELLQGKVQRKT